jgi:hypothetical protein
MTTLEQPQRRRSKWAWVALGFALAASGLSLGLFVAGR